MENIAGVEGNNIPGTEKFWFVPVQYVDEVPRARSGQITSDITLTGSNTWYEVEAVIETIGAGAKKNADHTYDHSIECRVRGDFAQLVAQLEEMQRMRFIIIRKDNSGHYKIKGNKEQTLRFEFEMLSGDGWRGPKGYRLRFYERLTVPEYYYTGEFSTSDETLDGKLCPDVNIYAPDGSVLLTVAAGTDVQLSDIIPRGYEYMHVSQQTTSYRTGDDVHTRTNKFADVPSLSWKIEIDPTDPTKLLENNEFGNKNRYTGINGNQTYTNGLVIDHHTGLMWPTTDYNDIVGSAPGSWDIAIDWAFGLTRHGYTGWFLPNDPQIQEALNSFSMGSSPITFLTSNVNYWTGSSTSSLNAINVAIISATKIEIINNAPKSFTASHQRAKPCRRHY